MRTVCRRCMILHLWELAKLDGRYKPAGGNAKRDSDDVGHACMGGKWVLAGICSNRRLVDIDKECIG